MSGGLPNVKRSQMAEACDLRGERTGFKQTYSERTGLLPSIMRCDQNFTPSQSLSALTFPCCSEAVHWKNVLQFWLCYIRKTVKLYVLDLIYCLTDTDTAILKLPTIWQINSFPFPYRVLLFNSWECDMAKLAQCQECDKLHITLS